MRRRHKARPWNHDPRLSLSANRPQSGLRRVEQADMVVEPLSADLGSADGVSDPAGAAVAR
jgi:hypothetical protein